MIKNEKGSFFIVLAILLLSGIAVTTLGKYLLGAQLTARNTTEIQLNAMYREDEIIEMSKNLILQKVMSKEWDYINTQDYLLSKSDVDHIQDYLNNVILLDLNKESRATIVLRNEVPLSSNCKVVYEEDVFGVDNAFSEEPDFVELDCYNNPVDIKYDIYIKRGSNESKFSVNLEDFKFQTIKNKTAIVVNKSDIYTFVH